MHLVDSYSRQLHPQLSKGDVVGAHAHPPADWEGEARDLGGRRVCMIQVNSSTRLMKAGTS